MKIARDTGSPAIFVGALSQPELVNHLHASSVIAFPSIARSEAFGISIMEAHACGKPVVATKLGTGTEFANLHDQTGLNVSPKDSTALAEALNELLGNESKSKSMGEYASARVRKEFHARDIARAEFELFQEVLS